MAHLTTSFSNEDEHNLIHTSRLAIYKLVLKHLPEIKKDAIWWYTQVETVS